MPKTLQPATPEDVTHVRAALALLRDARDRLAMAGASRAVLKVRDAIKSTDGALRHVERRADRS